MGSKTKAKKQDPKYSVAETTARMNAAIKAALGMAPIPHIKPKKAKKRRSISRA